MIQEFFSDWSAKKVLTHVLPHMVAVLFFAFLADGFYNKFDDGFKLRQSDSMNYMGMAKEAMDYRSIYKETTYWTGSMFSGMPTFQITGNSKNSVDLSKVLLRPFRNKFTSNEELTLWFGMIGAYLLALVFGVNPWLAMLAGVAFGLSSVNILYFGAGHRTKVRAIGFMPGVLAGAILSYRRNLWLGAVVSAFFLILHIAANHLQMTYYLIYVVGGFVLTELIFQWRNGHYYKAVMPGVLMLLAGLGSAIPNAANLMSTQEYAEYTTRGKGILELTDSDELRAAKEKAGESAVLKAKTKKNDGGGVEKIETGVNRGAGLGRDYILQYSMSYGEWLAVMCPNLYGGETTLYWGDQYFSAGAFYFGAIIIALFLAYFIAGRDRLKWPMIALTLLAIILSWRNMTPIMDFFIDYVPLFKKFRDTKMMLVMIQLMAGLGAVLALKELAQLGKAKKSGEPLPAQWTKRRNLWMGSLGGLMLLFGVFYIAPKLFFDFEPDVRNEALMQKRYAQAFMQQGGAQTMDDAMYWVKNQYWPENIMPQRVELFKEDVLRTLGFLVLTLTAAWVLIMGWVPLEIVAIFLVIVTSWDLWSVNRRYTNEDKVNGQYIHWMKTEQAKLPYTPSMQLLSILQQEEPNSAEYESARKKALRGIEFGYGGTIPREYKQLADVTSRFTAMRFETHFRVLKWDMPYTDAETPYFVQAIGGYHGAKLQRYQDFMEVVLMDERVAMSDSAALGKLRSGMRGMIGHRMLNTKYIMFDQIEQAVEMPEPAGPAWFVENVVVAESNNDEILSTRDLSDFKTAVVHQDFEERLADLPDSPGMAVAELVEYRPESIRYRASSENGGLLVFSEIWYPEGWYITIDGEESDLIRSNYLLRSVIVPPGEHEVEMYFSPSGGKGEMLANLGAAVMTLFLLGGLVLTFLTWKKEPSLISEE